MNLRKALLNVLLALAGMLSVIGGVTVGALSAYTEATATAQNRQASLGLMNEVHHEVELLSRLVSSYVATANPRFLLYYYDILAMREGSKLAPEFFTSTYWEQVIGGLRPYVAPQTGQGISLAERMGKLGFEADEKDILGQVLQLAERMKEVEQVAFAATQGLYDPVRSEFVSEADPQPEFAQKLLHQAAYLKLRADMAIAVDDLAQQVEKRTNRDMEIVGDRLRTWIVAALLLLICAGIALMAGFYYLKRHLLVPLTALHRTAAALAEKSYGQRVGPLRGVEEVQVLAGTLDSMAAAIEADIAQREAVQQSLRQAQAKAQSAAEAKTIFLANMSHEIRTPMNAIIGMAYLALKSGLPPRQHDYVSKINAAARSLLGILNDILDFTKVEAGKIVLESVHFDLELVIQNAFLMVQEKAEGKELELVLDYPVARSFRHLRGDPLRLGQILINLLSNAVKFTEGGHVRLSVAETTRDDQSVTLSFAIEDSGIGMDPEQVGQLFQEFSQADGSITRKYGGTGLGLAISRRLVEAMGGEIVVHSRPGAGSVFRFAIPLSLETNDWNDLPEMRVLAGRRALVVDDFEIARESMAQMLMAMGCRSVVRSQSGADAVARLVAAAETGAAFDLLILDWLLPDMSGAGVIEALQAKRLALPKNTIVVSMTDPNLLRQEASHAGISEIVQKPLFPEALRALVRTENKQQSVLSGERTPTPQAGCLRGMPILLVEDNELNQLVAEELLGSWGALVDMAENGQVALDKLAKCKTGEYALVLMDIEMPVMDGREAVRQLRADSRFADLPIIAMTAHVTGHATQSRLIEGVSGHIAKPFEPEDLLAMIQPYWHPSPPSSSAAQTSASLNAEEQALIGAIGEIPGIDQALLLRRFAGRLSFLAGALHRFLGDYRNWLAGLQRMLAQGDIEAAQRTVHTLKGLSGSFAMLPLQSALSGLETSLQAGKLEPKDRLYEVEAQLQPLLSALETLPAVLPGHGGHEGLAGVEKILDRLVDYLREGDGEVEEIWRQNRSSFARIIPVRQLALMDHAIGQWNFDEALAIVSQLNMHGGSQ